ncbi:MAG: prolyl oligopeptidase family serine peptidase [Planctomycetes bacterium]|nr:prolyl oligopeptidase family serine peptidase [Planctomycetota bacterium]
MPNTIRFLVILLLLLSQTSLCADNIFAPYLTDKPPKIVEEISKTVTDGVEVTKLKFLNRHIAQADEDVIIYGILARPAKPGKYPGVLVVHGGGGYADMVEPAVIGWAKRGYISFCQDQPGICNRTKGSSTGPWAKLKWSTFTADPDATCSMLYDGVAAALNGLAMLRSQPDVDKANIGITGGSWGGYMTTMISGLAGDRIKASFAVYGCGYYDVGSAWTARLEAMPAKERKQWLTHLDAGRRAPGIRSHFFVTPAADDWYFWPCAVMATYDRITSPKNIAFSPNDSHRITIPGGTSGPQKLNRRANRTYMEIVWLDYYLKGEGKPFPTCTAVGKPTRKGDGIEVRFKVDAPLPIKSATVWHSFGEMPWRNRWWEKVEAVEEKDHVYSAVIPVTETECPINWFGLVTDERDITVSTIMQTVDPSAVGFKPDERRDRLFAEDFETRDALRKWQRPYARRYKGAKHKVCAEAAHTGKMGLRIQGKMTVRCDGIRGEALRRSGSKGLSLWARSPGGTDFDVLLMGEAPNSLRTYWAVRVKNPGPDWTQIDLPWDHFKLRGKKEPPFDMLSPRLGQLRFTTPEKADIHIDDIQTMME